MKTNVVELADQIRSYGAGTPVVVSECYWHRPRDKSAWTWIFTEGTKLRLTFLWSGVLARVNYTATPPAVVVSGQPGITSAMRAT